MDYNYKESIQKIHDLDWSEVPPARIVYQALCFAKEFSTTLRECYKTYHAVPEFISFYKGEIDTGNLQYADYNQKADHYKFLDHFYYGRYSKMQYPYIDVGHATRESLARQDRATDLKEQIALSDYQILMEPLNSLRVDSMPLNSLLRGDSMMATLVSREESLKGIFEKILKSHKWDKEGYGYFAYFLRRHIDLDSADGGHEELTSRLIDLEDYEEVLNKFWLLRWRVYKTLL
ncbi:hypothetical protein KA013_00885 [Patescibacteria group bacterium]|nr:hypothetical protein [Patescibacteria group bacterium]